MDLTGSRANLQRSDRDSADLIQRLCKNELVQERYIRYQGVEANHRGQFPGIYGLANGLARAGKLSPGDYLWWQAANAFGDAAYPDPSALHSEVYNRQINPHAQAWFKTSAKHLIAYTAGYLVLLRKYGVAVVELRSNNPGALLYEDSVQIVVNPY